MKLPILLFTCIGAVVLMLQPSCQPGASAPAVPIDPQVGTLAAEDLRREVASLPKTRELAPKVTSYTFLRRPLFSPDKFDFGVTLDELGALKEVVVRYVDRNPRLDWIPGRSDSEIAALLVRELNPFLASLNLGQRPTACEFLGSYACEAYWAKQFTIVQDDPYIESRRIKSGEVCAGGDAVSSSILNGLDVPRGDCKDLGAAVCRTINGCRSQLRLDGQRYSMNAGPTSTVVRDATAPDKVEPKNHICVLLSLKDAAGRYAVIPSDPYVTDAPGPAARGNVESVRARWKFFPLSNEELNSFSWLQNGRLNKQVKLDGMPFAMVWLEEQAQGGPNPNTGGVQYSKQIWRPLGARDVEAKAMYEYLQNTGPLR
ncbi:MAG: hypothetical protein KIS66_06335 [Fimbriimonadaceae bacterium]|nr:hypothetical protein [Fimbriimonadaceae bacterium]